MSKHDNNPEIDRILRTWNRRRQAAKNFDDLNRRVLTEWTKVKDAAEIGDISPRPEDGARRKSIRWPGIFCVAASLAAIVTSGWFVFNFKNTGPKDSFDPPAVAWFQEDQLQKQAVLLREMETIFENRLAWLAESNGHISIEMLQNQQAGGGANPSAEVAVRIVVLKRDADQAQWTPVWSADVLAHQEEVIRLTPELPNLPSGSRLSLWTYVLDNGLIAVDSAFSLQELVKQSTFNGLQHSGVPTAAHTLERHGEEYRIYQTVAKLDG
jgi:hypothetical protein